jgi:hypothetical protein
MRRPIKDLVKDLTWQKVRESLLGKWAEHPEECCKVLRRFMGDIHSTSNEKLRILMNYLTGTGFRTGRISHPCITKLRSEISVEIRRRKMTGKWE